MQRYKSETKQWASLRQFAKDKFMRRGLSQMETGILRVKLHQTFTSIISVTLNKLKEPVKSVSQLMIVISVPTYWEDEECLLCLRSNTVAEVQKGTVFSLEYVADRGGWPICLSHI